MKALLQVLALAAACSCAIDPMTGDPWLESDFQKTLHPESLARLDSIDLGIIYHNCHAHRQLGYGPYAERVADELVARGITDRARVEAAAEGEIWDGMRPWELAIALGPPREIDREADSPGLWMHYARAKWLRASFYFDPVDGLDYSIKSRQ